MRRWTSCALLMWMGVVTGGSHAAAARPPARAVGPASWVAPIHGLAVRIALDRNAVASSLPEALRSASDDALHALTPEPGDP